MVLFVSDFVLVDNSGFTLLGQKEGLLLYKTGTVCDSNFSDQSAEAVCQKMGYYAAKSWRSGLLYETQQNDREIALGSVSCMSGDWSSCELSTTNACSHSNDIFLRCHGGKLIH